MAAEVRCTNPSCGRPSRLGADALGRTFRCVRCGTKLPRATEAMRADVEDPDGTGRSASVPGMGICAKTGTAQIKLGRKVIGLSTWFASFAPYDDPRYVVVVMVEDGSSGGFCETFEQLAEMLATLAP